MLELILKGIIIGFVVAAPVGPIAVLCIQRSLASGFRMGFMTGLGAAVADGLFGLIAGIGFSAVLSELMANRNWIAGLGGICLMGLGLRLIFLPFREKDFKGKDEKDWHAITTAFFLTLTNPLTILAFVSVFATVGLKALNYHSAIILAAGIMVGSACWWLLLSFTVALILHHRLSASAMQWINRLSGLVFVFFGLMVLVLIKQFPSLI